MLDAPDYSSYVPHPDKEDPGDFLQEAIDKGWLNDPCDPCDPCLPPEYFEDNFAMQNWRDGWWSPTFQGRTGVMVNVSDASWDIHNFWSDPPQTDKDIWIQLTYREMNRFDPDPEFDYELDTVVGGGGDSQSGDLVSFDVYQQPGDWITKSFLLHTAPNPSRELLTIYSDYIIAIDQIVIDTLCYGERTTPTKALDLKWSQPPIEYDPTEPEPRYCGWDEWSNTLDPCALPSSVADDFRCFGSMPIDSIHWWGSYIGWLDIDPPAASELDPPITAWHIGFWSNVPAGGDPCFSHPDMLLWDIEIPAERVAEERAGIDDHPFRGQETCFQYYVDLEPNEVFWQADFLPITQDDTFWLSITAMYPEPDPCNPDSADPCYPWGWKTRPWSWMDDGVAFFLMEKPQPGSVTDPCSMFPLEFEGESYDLAFELDTDPNWVKWDQPFTGIRHWSHYEDITSMAEVLDGFPAYHEVAADDWECQGPSPVTALAWYGSYLDYLYRPCDPCFISGRPEKPAYFDVSIWTDFPDPDPCSPDTWSHPDKIVWQYDVYNYDEVLVGSDKIPEDPCGNPLPGPREAVFRYTAPIPDPNWFWQSEEEAVYWLMIVAVYEGQYPEYEWGWTNHYHTYNDDAVIGEPIGGPRDFGWTPLKDQTGETADLSFTIYTDPTAELDFGDANDPTYPTLLASDGARHIIGGPWFGIAGDDEDVPDAETDGQPDPCALGDDNNGNDDENGVSFPSLKLDIARSCDVYVSGGGGIVEIWIDYNRDGDWNDPNEMVHNTWLADGSNPVLITAPQNARTGRLFARCRISTNGTGSPAGLAIDGEVEDYRVLIKGYDWGDAPAPYPTLDANDGAWHFIGGPWFGPADDYPDGEADGQPDPNALGDDSDGNDDEDGITIPTLIRDTTQNISVEVSGGGGDISGWIDFNDDGDWIDSGEKIIDNINLSNGIHLVPVTVPNDAALGETFARFRIYVYDPCDPCEIGPAGTAPGGEVEDYKVTIEPGLDFGDAPDPNYPTLLANDGARHYILGPWFGLAGDDAPDPDPNGQPDLTASGDDNDGNDDEDGVSISLVHDKAIQCTVNVSGGGGIVEIWIDYNGDGDWNDPCEMVHNAWLADGSHGIWITAPQSAILGFTYARCRISSAGTGSPAGLGADGEVEDHRIQITATDFGDAPAPYPTLYTNSGAFHFMNSTRSPRFGPDDDAPDGEADGKPDPNALGDDNDYSDDEDGITIPILIQGATQDITVEVSGGGGKVYGWIDFNDNGDWSDSGEKIIDGTFLPNGVNLVGVTVPNDAVVGETFARFRIHDPCDPCEIGPEGSAFSGEVEDHQVSIRALDFGDAPDPNYPTLLANDGARHYIGGPWFGLAGDDAPDSDPNGQPNSLASGDDNDGNDDEDGVGVSGLDHGKARQWTVNVSGGGGIVEIWIDYNGDGDWNNPGEMVHNAYLADGSHGIWITAPQSAIIGWTYARCRISSAGTGNPAGLAADGEVEDHRVELSARDFGDAPAPYPTLEANSGAVHFLNSTRSPRFGPADDAPDGEGDGQPDADALGDDNDYSDDEDGITIPTLIRGMTQNITVQVSGGGGLVWGWVDWNNNGDWQFSENIIYLSFLSNGVHSIPVTVPNDAALGETFARFRIHSSDGILDPTGFSLDGEVEDHKVTIVDCSECGDFDESGTVEINDVRILGINWQWEGTPGDNIADLNCDGRVDNEDFVIFSQLWQEACP
jgi:hypothetical protein